MSRLWKRGARVIIFAQPSLHRVLRTLSPTVAVVNTTEGLGKVDYVCATFSLPLAFSDQPIPNAIPYLRATPEAAAAWRARIGSQGFKIGVCWSGLKSAGADRSFPLALLSGLARLPSVRLISLQKDGGREDIAALPAGMTVEVLDAAHESGDFLDPAAVMANLDLVITCDTSAANLAGGLGCRTWVAAKHVADWRWQSSGPTTPWFPSARVFRQPIAGDWQSVFAEMEDVLRSERA